MAKISQKHIKEWQIPLPSKEEQDLAVNFLDKQLDTILDMVSEVECSIEFLKEHRTALISAAVTGKIDVRDQVK